MFLRCIFNQHKYVKQWLIFSNETKGEITLVSIISNSQSYTATRVLQLVGWHIIANDSQWYGHRERIKNLIYGNERVKYGVVLCNFLFYIVHWIRYKYEIFHPDKIQTSVCNKRGHFTKLTCWHPRNWNGELGITETIWGYISNEN